ncbi:SMI1/KNR4 family protein [Bacillus zanthoxyli]|nr:SMI1/KNR4 family protein [Bacillus zanthoxyli]
MKMERIHESLSIEDLERFEHSHSITIPREYRDFLLEYNGGYPNPSVYKISEKLGESIVNIFYGIGTMYDNLEKKFDLFDEIVEAGFMAIADDPSGNQICIGISNQYFGQVYHWAHGEETEEMENIYFLSNSFNDFLNCLYED